MKKAIVALVMFTGLNITANAQQDRPVPAGKGKRIQQQNLTVDERAARHANKAEKELGLSADQKVKWEAATKERMNGNAPIKEKLMGSTTPGERKQLHQQAKVVNDKFDNDVNAFLTPEQKAKYEAMKKQKQEERKAMMKGAKSDREPLPPGMED